MGRWTAEQWVYRWYSVHFKSHGVQPILKYAPEKCIESRLPSDFVQLVRTRVLGPDWQMQYSSTVFQSRTAMIANT
jgi:hypothetical protein